MVDYLSDHSVPADIREKRKRRLLTGPSEFREMRTDLPKTKAQPLSQDREPLSVSVRRDGRIYLQRVPVDEADLVPRLTAIATNGYDQRVFVRGDQAVDYGRVMEVMALISSAGFTHIGLVTDVARKKHSDE